jgi:hypothetical protein
MQRTAIRSEVRLKADAVAIEVAKDGQLLF